MYLFKKNMLCLYYKYIYMLYKLYEYKYIHVNIFEIYTVCVCIYIDNKGTQHTHLLCKQKLLFWMRLITIHCLTALNQHFRMISEESRDI